MKLLSIIPLSLALAIGGASGILANVGHDDQDDHGAHVTRLLMPIMSSSRGLDLFVEKGCVACHAVNGVGGHDAVALDAHDMDEFMNPFDLAAKMWTMAPYMITAQEEAFGEQIFFTGDELADIIAFLHDDVQQHEFSEHDLTEQALVMMNHGHGDVSGADEHEEEIGHDDEGEEHEESNDEHVDDGHAHE